MQLNLYSTTAKRITKMTSKAKAALEEKATGTSKKRRSDGDNMNEQPKKVKTTPPAGSAPTNSTSAPTNTTTAPQQDRPAITASESSLSSRVVVRTEEEEEALYVTDTESSNETTAEDELSMFNNELEG